MKNILVTGGAGYIGSHCVISLSKKDIRPIVVDKFSNRKHDIIYKIEQIVKKKIIFYNIDLREKVKLNN